MDSILTRAYSVYLNESVQHLQEIQTLLSSQKPSKEELTRAAVRFHTIRGGAGFFGLTTILQLARALEELAKQKEFESSEDLNHLKRALAQLQSEIATLPLDPSELSVIRTT